MPSKGTSTPFPKKNSAKKYFKKFEKRHDFFSEVMFLDVIVLLARGRTALPPHPTLFLEGEGGGRGGGDVLGNKTLALELTVSKLLAIPSVKALGL